jgi:hypothetical protein
VLFELGEPALKWQIGGVLQPRISTASLEFVQVPVFAASAGAPIDPTPFTVEFAFESGLGAPVSQDWVPGSWDVTQIGGYVAQCKVGAGGAVALTAGSYYTWVRITAGVETPVHSCGLVTVI